MSSEGNLVGAAGGGAAYRTPNAYGAIGGVALVPFEGEGPRIFATSNGYWRFGSQLDLYHYAVFDFVGSNAVNTGITNLSVGANYKPSPRLRITGSYNRVDTQTLNVQAGAFLNSADTGNSIIDNEVYIQRIATDEAARQRRRRPRRPPALRGHRVADLPRAPRRHAVLARRHFDPGGPGPMTTTALLPAEQSVEAYASFTDRRSIANLRLGVDALRTFGIGSVSYAHTELLSARVSAAHDIMDGRGEWEAEISYTADRR